MKVKSVILSAIMLGAFAISPIYAVGSGSSGEHGGASDHDRDPTGADRSGGEMNHDNDLQGSENSARRHHRHHATPVNDVGVGEPSNPNNSFNASKELLRDHR